MSNQRQMLMEAARTGQPLNFEFFEENSGIVELRKVLRETKPNTPERMTRSQRAIPYVEAVWNQMSSGLHGMAIPKVMKTGMSRMFHRLKTDRDFAKFAYNNLPIIADRYGYGKQIDGKPRLSFVMMNRDPLCIRLIK